MLLEDYCRSLDDLPAESIEKAAAEAMKSEKFLPPPAVLRDYVQRVRRRMPECACGNYLNLPEEKARGACNACDRAAERDER